MTFYNSAIKSEGLLDGESFRLGMTKVTLSASSYVLSASSTRNIVFEGNTAGQTIRLPEATTLQQGHEFFIVNESNTAYATLYYYDNVTPLLSIPPNTRTHIIAKTVTTSNGEWIYDQTSSSSLSNTSFFGFYNGNANAGRYLEIYPGFSSDGGPYLVVGDSAIVALSLGASSTSTGTAGVYKSTDLTTPIVSLSLGGAQTVSTTGFYVLLNDGDKLSIKVNAGSEAISKPYMTVYLIGR